ncbi:MAG: hypothetical protein RR889_06850, partial [Akkermansia sp.]
MPDSLIESGIFYHKIHRFSLSSYFVPSTSLLYQWAIYRAVNPPLVVRLEADANTSLCSVNATR